MTKSRRRTTSKKPAARRRNRTGETADRAPAPANEATLWAARAAKAGVALDFWNGFLILRMGPAGDKPLDAAALGRLLTIVRAVSWVESRHGTAGANQPARDPMQCGNPADAWWKQIIVPGGPGQDRFITGPGGTNYWAGDLPQAVSGRPNFPAAAQVSVLGDPKKGHADAAFNEAMSYCWGAPILIHKINSQAGAQTYRCGDLSRDRLIEGAVAYNGGGDPKYRDKIVKALDEIGGLPLAPKKAGLRRPQALRLADASEALSRLAAVAAELASPARCRVETTVSVTLSDGEARVTRRGSSAVRVTLRFDGRDRAPGSPEISMAAVRDLLALIVAGSRPSGVQPEATIELPLDLVRDEQRVTMTLGASSETATCVVRVIIEGAREAMR